MSSYERPVLSRPRCRLGVRSLHMWDIVQFRFRCARSAQRMEIPGNITVRRKPHVLTKIKKIKKSRTHSALSQLASESLASKSQVKIPSSSREDTVDV